MKELLISLRSKQVAVIEDGRLEELYLEAATSDAGKIYKGRITHVEPALQAAFVDFGERRNGFLHAWDVNPDWSASFRERPLPSRGGKHRLAISETKARVSIQDLLKVGQDVAVQVIKPASGSKGARVSTYLSLPGMYLVLMPGVHKIALSGKISDPKDRLRLQKIVKELDRPKELGVIVRQSATGRGREDLEADLRLLLSVWQSVVTEFQKSGGTPRVIYAPGDVVIRAIGGLYDSNIRTIHIDDPEATRRAQDYLKGLALKDRCRVELYQQPESMFSHFGVEEEIAKLREREVPLPSGGRLVIEPVEALVSILVKPGTQRPTEEVDLRTNLEASTAIARQLRLRNLGGLIVTQFLITDQPANERAVERSLLDACRRDRGLVRMLPTSEFGLVQIARRAIQSLSPVEFSEAIKTAVAGTKIFISYRRSDSIHQAGRIDEWLARTFGRDNVFFDVDTIPLGVNWKEFIEEWIQRSAIVLVPIGDHWLEEMKKREKDDQDMVRFEIQAALRLGIPLIPLEVGRASIPTHKDLSASIRKLADYNGMKLRPGRDFESDMKRLIRALEKQEIPKTGH